MNINPVLHDIRSIGFIMYTLVAGDWPWHNRCGKRFVEGVKMGYFSFTNALWKKITPEALKFVARLTKPMEASETYERLLQDRFIEINRGTVGFRDLPIDNIGKIRKIYLMHMLEAVIIAIKQRRYHKKFFISF
jgi:hypothetical protein